MTKYKATRDSAKTASEMGRGWRSKVWGKTDWHWSIVHASGMAMISPCVGIDGQQVKEFCCMIGPEVEALGGAWSEHGRTPQAAFENTLRRLRGDIEPLMELSATKGGVA